VLNRSCAVLDFGEGKVPDVGRSRVSIRFRMVLEGNGDGIVKLQSQGTRQLC